MVKHVVDLLSGWGVGDLVVSGSPGDDQLEVGFGGNTVLGSAGNDELTDIEITIDRDLNAGDIFRGGDGDDQITSHAGPDTLLGGAGNDTIKYFWYNDHGGLQADRLEMHGGGGQDILALSCFKSPDPFRGVIDGGSGFDVLDVTNSTTSSHDISAVELSGIEHVRGHGLVSTIDQLVVLKSASIILSELTGRGGTLDLSGSSGMDLRWIIATDLQSALTLKGNSMQRSVAGSQFDDWLQTSWLEDTLAGGGGSDTLAGGSGDDVMTGGAGDDLYHVDSRGDVVTEMADEGVDSIRASLSWSLGDNVEHLVLTGKGGTFGDGNALDNQITGNRAGNVLSGKDGDDTLNGRMGADKLWGGAGDDVFVFDTALNGRNVDRIGDFGNGDDTIQLGSTVFTALGMGALAGAAFQSGDGSATTADARILYDAATGALSYDADGSGSTAAIQFAILKPGLALTADDFVVV